MARLSKTAAHRAFRRNWEPISNRRQVGVTRQAIHQLRNKVRHRFRLSRRNAERNKKILGMYKRAGKTGTALSAKNFELSVSPDLSHHQPLPREKERRRT